MKRFFLILLTVIFFIKTEVYAEPIDVKAQGAILIDAETGVVIFSKNANQKLYPASITKLMTVLLTLEYANGNYSEDVYFSRDAVYTLPYDSSGIAMDYDETLTLEQCLYAILLASANEVSNAVAEHIAGSMDAFAATMSRRAEELGCVNTNFKNPHGLHDDEHYTCAYDMSLIMKECVKYPDFIRFISTSYYAIPPTQKQPEIRHLNNTNKLIRTTSDFYNEYVIGGKTGFTDEAGHTLVTYAQKNNKKLICVVMKTAKNEIYTDTTALLNYGFEQYTDFNVFNKSNFSASLRVVQTPGNSENTTEINVLAARDVKMNLPNTFILDDVEQKVIMPEKITAPVTEGEKVGHLILLYQGVFLADVDLLAGASAELISPSLNIESVKKETELEEPTEEPINLNNPTITIAIIAVSVILLFLAVKFIWSATKKYRLYKRKNAFLKSSLSKRYRYKNQ